MTVDPLFRFNPDLPELSNVHQAERVTECDSSVYEFQAPWRIDFPQGTTIRGTPDSIGTWPDAVSEQPANFRVLTLSTTGEGAVLADNAELINTDLSTYNAGVPGGDSPSLGTDGMPSGIFDNGGIARPQSNDACSSSAAALPVRTPVPFVTILGTLIGAACLRRRTRRPERSS
jgi:hypothetical protein